MSGVIYRHTVIDYGPDPIVKLSQFLTNTKNLNLPINCVVAGNQYDPIKKKAGSLSGMTGPMRGIFGE